MRESYVEGVAITTAVSCALVSARASAKRWLRYVRAGLLSREIGLVRGADAVIPGSGLRPVLMSSVHAFDTSSVDRFRSPSWPTAAALDGATFPQTLSTNGS